jgi:hypothetical protein
MLESEVKKRVLNKLEMAVVMGEVIWHTRLNVGMAITPHGAIKLCDAGTPDIISIVKCNNGNVAILFIECKRSNVKKLRDGQELFFDKMKDIKGVSCVLINNPNQLWPAIREAQKL